MKAKSWPLLAIGLISCVLSTTSFAAEVSMNASSSELINIIESENYTQVSEANTSLADSYQVVLGKKPSAPVTVTVNPGEGSAPAGKLDLGNGPGQAVALHFDQFDWNVPKTVTLRAVNDSLTPRVGDRVLIGHEAASVDSSFNGTTKTLQVNVLENDYRSTELSIPTFDLSAQMLASMVEIDVIPGGYLGQPDSALHSDKSTMIIGYPEGHGRPNTILQRSTDGGASWSGRLSGLPANFIDPDVTAPTIHSLIDAQGVERFVIMRTQRLPRQMQLSLSDDKGLSWTAFAPMFPQFAPYTGNGSSGGSPPKSVLPIKDAQGNNVPGKYITAWYANNNGSNAGDGLGMYFAYTHDGGQHWDTPFRGDIYDPYGGIARANESAMVRSPDGKQLLRIARVGSANPGPLVMLSDDEGKSWSQFAEAPTALTGERHTFRYAPDGRLLVFFRDYSKANAEVSTFDPILWVGSYADIVNQTDGQYRVRLMDNKAEHGEAAYGTMHVLPDDSIRLNMYVDTSANDIEDPDIIGIKFTMADLDNVAQNLPMEASPIGEFSYSGILGTSPVSQGWSNISTALNSHQLENNDGHGSVWQADGRAGKAAWQIATDSVFNTKAITNGWRMTVNMRLVSGGYVTNYYGNGSERFLPVIKLETDGSLTASLLEGSSHTLLSSGGGDEFHRYELKYDPLSGLADFSFDGQLIESWAGQPSSQSKIAFGNSSSTVDAVVNYSRVMFEILPAAGNTIGRFGAYQATKPTEQGWTKNTNGSGTGSMVSDQGAKAWQVNGTGGLAAWQMIPDALTNEAASTYGWTMKWTARVLSGAYVTNYYDNGSRRFLSMLKLNSEGDLDVTLTGGNTHNLLKGTGSEKYHDYELRYNAINNQAIFSFDGKQIKIWSGVPTSSNLIAWGNASSNKNSVVNYRSFSFETSSEVFPIDISPPIEPPPPAASNQLPVIYIPENKQVTEGVLVELDASQTIDADGDTLSFSWLQTSGPTVELSGELTAHLSFASPQVSADTRLEFSLSVDDGHDSVSASIEVLVVPKNEAPVIGGVPHNLTVSEGSVISVTPEISDPEGDSLSYSWQQLSGPVIEFGDRQATNLTFTAPQVTYDQAIELQFTVFDGELATSVNINILILDSDKNEQNPSDTDVEKSSGGSIYWLFMIIAVSLVGKLRWRFAFVGNYKFS